MNHPELGSWAEELGHLGWAWSKASAPPHQDEPVELAWASVWDASIGTSSGYIHQKEAPLENPKTEFLCLSAGLAWPSIRVTANEGIVGDSTVTVALTNRLQISSRRWMDQLIDGWIDGWNNQGTASLQSMQFEMTNTDKCEHFSC